MTQIPGEPLGRLMEELDGTCFSHSGIALERAPDTGVPRIASALAHGMSVGVDWGGIRRDPLTDFWPHRDFYCIPMEQNLRARALKYVDRFPEKPVADGGFSFTKLVTIAVALHAADLTRAGQDLGPRLFDAAHDAARAWTATDDRPNFYCAEFVATAYGRPFTRGELNPPLVVRGGGGLLPDLGDVMSALVDLVGDEVVPTPEQKATRKALLDLLRHEDLGFLGRATGAVLASIPAVFRGPVGPVAVPDPLPPAEPAGDPDAVLPDSLVTPRMLWAAFGRDKLARVAQP